MISLPAVHMSSCLPVTPRGPECSGPGQSWAGADVGRAEGRRVWYGGEGLGGQ